ncbi:MAG: hypothetical protein Q7R41_19840 [Phycisphaerales bacterium]|nr:hypothetical protein [Phycisphaerales bacterium]
MRIGLDPWRMHPIWVWRKMPMGVILGMGVILSAAKNLPAGWDASLRDSSLRSG